MDKGSAAPFIDNRRIVPAVREHLQRQENPLVASSITQESGEFSTLSLPAVDVHIMCVLTRRAVSAKQVCFLYR
jgi:hypothetical protein